MSHIRQKTGYVTIVKLLAIICRLLLKYREYQASIQTPTAMAAWDGLMDACELFLEVVVDPRTILE